MLNVKNPLIKRFSDDITNRNRDVGLTAYAVGKVFEGHSLTKSIDDFKDAGVYRISVPSGHSDPVIAGKTGFICINTVNNDKTTNVYRIRQMFYPDSDINTPEVLTRIGIGTLNGGLITYTWSIWTSAGGSLTPKRLTTNITGVPGILYYSFGSHNLTLPNANNFSINTTIVLEQHVGEGNIIHDGKTLNTSPIYQSSYDTVTGEETFISTINKCNRYVCVVSPTTNSDTPSKEWVIYINEDPYRIASLLNDRINRVVTRADTNLNNVSQSISQRITNDSSALNSSITQVSKNLSVTISATSSVLNSSITQVSKNLSVTISAASSALNSSITQVSKNLSETISATGSALNSSITQVSSALNSSITQVSKNLSATISATSSALNKKINDNYALFTNSVDSLIDTKLIVRGSDTNTILGFLHSDSSALNSGISVLSNNYTNATKTITNSISNIIDTKNLLFKNSARPIAEHLTSLHAGVVTVSQNLTNKLATVSTSLTDASSTLLASITINSEAESRHHSSFLRFSNNADISFQTISTTLAQHSNSLVNIANIVTTNKDSLNSIMETHNLVFDYKTDTIVGLLKNATSNLKLYAADLYDNVDDNIIKMSNTLFNSTVVAGSTKFDVVYMANQAFSNMITSDVYADAALASAIFTGHVFSGIYRTGIYFEANLAKSSVTLVSGQVTSLSKVMSASLVSVLNQAYNHVEDTRDILVSSITNVSKDYSAHVADISGSLANVSDVIFSSPSGIIPRLDSITNINFNYYSSITNNYKSITSLSYWADQSFYEVSTNQDNMYTYIDKWRLTTYASDISDIEVDLSQIRNSVQSNSSTLIQHQSMIVDGAIRMENLIDTKSLLYRGENHPVSVQLSRAVDYATGWANTLKEQIERPIYTASPNPINGVLMPPISAMAQSAFDVALDLTHNGTVVNGVMSPISRTRTEYVWVSQLQNYSYYLVPYQVTANIGGTNRFSLIEILDSWGSVMSHGKSLHMLSSSIGMEHQSITSLSKSLTSASNSLSLRIDNISQYVDNVSSANDNAYVFITNMSESLGAYNAMAQSAYDVATKINGASNTYMTLNSRLWSWNAATTKYLRVGMPIQVPWNGNLKDKHTALFEVLNYSMNSVLSHGESLHVISSDMDKLLSTKQLLWDGRTDNLPNQLTSVYHKGTAYTSEQLRVLYEDKYNFSGQLVSKAISSMAQDGYDLIPTVKGNTFVQSNNTYINMGLSSFCSLMGRVFMDDIGWGWGANIYSVQYGVFNVFAEENLLRLIPGKRYLTPDLILLKDPATPLAHGLESLAANLNVEQHSTFESSITNISVLNKLSPFTRTYLNLCHSSPQTLTITSEFTDLDYKNTKNLYVTVAAPTQTILLPNTIPIFEVVPNHSVYTLGDGYEGHVHLCMSMNNSTITSGTGTITTVIPSSVVLSINCDSTLHTVVFSNTGLQQKTLEASPGGWCEVVYRAV